MSDTSRMIPAYAPFDAFEAFVGKLNHSGIVPDVIHKSLMPNLSGAVQGHLLASLKFLGLTDSKNQPQQALHDLVEAHGTEAWKPALKKVLDKAYAPILGDLNIKTAIAKTLIDRFRTNGKTDGDTLKKSIRFFLKALSSAGAEVSPHIRKDAKLPKVSANGKLKPRVSSDDRPHGKTSEPAEPDAGEPDKSVPPGMMSQPLYFPGKPTGQITIHEDLTDADVELVSAILKAYAKRRAGK